MLNQDELRHYLYLIEKHRAAYAIQEGIPDRIKERYLKELDKQIKDIKEDLTTDLLPN